jgi:hypothetical protein
MIWLIGLVLLAAVLGVGALLEVAVWVLLLAIAAVVVGATFLGRAVGGAGDRRTTT